MSLMIRRLQWGGDDIRLVADNPDVPNQEISLDRWHEDYEPIDRALEVIQRLRAPLQTGGLSPPFGPLSLFRLSSPRPGKYLDPFGVY